MDHYGLLSGSDNSYAFFAPGVAPEFRVTFTLTDADGNTWEESGNQGATREAELRYDSMTSIAAALPFVNGVALLVLYAAFHWSRRLPARASLLAPPLRYALGGWRWPLLVGTAVGAVLLFVLPLTSLVCKAGWVDAADAWSFASLQAHLTLVWKTERLRLASSLLIAVSSGAVWPEPWRC